MENKIQLSPKKLVAKEFKIDFKGYNAEEVDHYLDIIVNDYTAFASMLNESYEMIESLENKIQEQREKIVLLEKDKAMQADNIQAMEENLSSNVDILKRISLLEKAVFNQNK